MTEKEIGSSENGFWIELAMGMVMIALLLAYAWGTITSTVFFYTSIPICIASLIGKQRYPDCREVFVICSAISLTVGVNILLEQHALASKMTNALAYSVAFAVFGIYVYKTEGEKALKKTVCALLVLGTIILLFRMK